MLEAGECHILLAATWDSTLDHIQLKWAWQTAFELRTCPDCATLFADSPDEQLQRHLQMCHVCREKREIPVDQRAAWEELLQWFGAVGQKPATKMPPVPGQVWNMQRSLAGWGKDCYFYQPPRILLLDKIDDAKGFRAVQLSGDRYLMAEGDVWLDDRFGFAEGWNSYSVHEKALAGCWGAVLDYILAQVVEATEQKHHPVAEDSILYFFRRLEISVGARVAIPSVAVLVEEIEQKIVEVVELIPGLNLAVKGAGRFVLDITTDTLELLRGTFMPALVLRGAVKKSASPKLSDEKKQFVMEHCPVVPVDLKIAGDTLTITLKWLRKRAVEAPGVTVWLNGMATDASISADGVFIMCSGNNISKLCNLQPVIEFIVQADCIIVVLTSG